MFVLGGMLLAVALVAAFALVVCTAILGHETTRVSAADARMRASLRTKVALLWYARAADVAVEASSAPASEEQSQAEAQLRSALADTRRLALPEEWPRLDSLARKAQSYIALRRELETARRPLPEIVGRATPLLQDVFADLDELIASDDARTRVVEASSQRWHAIANALGIVSAALLLMGFAAAIIITRLLVERPILALTAAMFRFARGDHRSRTVPGGARELRQVASTFNDLADWLVRQDEERLAFLAGVAHDLRNPISALRLATDALGRGAQPPAPDKAARTLAIVARQVARLDRMVGDLLDAARVEAGRFELRPETVDLRSIAGTVVDLLRPTSEAHSLELVTSEAPVLAVCDPTRIEQVVTNLVSNGLKYSPAGGRVVIAVGNDVAGGTVAVTDEGVGIRPEDHERILRAVPARGSSGARHPRRRPRAVGRAQARRGARGQARGREPARRGGHLSNAAARVPDLRLSVTGGARAPHPSFRRASQVAGLGHQEAEDCERRRGDPREEQEPGA